MDRSSTRTGGPTAADWVILTGAAGYLAWTVVPHWYRAGGGKAYGIPLPSYTFNAWRGTTTFAAVLALVAVAWLGLRRGGVGLRMRTDPATVDLSLGTAGVALTLLGLALPPAAGVGRTSVSWAFPVGVVLALVWFYGALRKYRERRRLDHVAMAAGSGFDPGVRP